MANLLDAIIASLVGQQNQPRKSVGSDVVRNNGRRNISANVAPVQQQINQDIYPDFNQLQQVPLNMPSFAQNMPNFQQSPAPQSFMPSEAQVPTGGNFRDFLMQLGIPLAATAIGLSSDAALPAAAGFNVGFGEGRQKKFENQLKEKENQMKAQLYRDGKTVNMINPITGELQEVGNVGYKDVVYKGALTPEQMKQRAIASGEAEFTKKNIEQSGKLGTAIKRLALINKQYSKALPSGDRTPLEQRIYGGAESWAVKKGLINNPELLALQKNIRPMAINLIRAFGEVGNLSESEQKGAIDTVNLPNLTDAERIAQTKQFIEFALAGANEEGKALLRKSKDMQGILDAFGVNLNEEAIQPGIPEVGQTFNGKKVIKVTRIE